MSMTGLSVFDTTLHKTNQWLNDLMQLLDWTDKNKAYLALRVTLHALRDRLTIDEVAQLAAQLPMLVRGFYYEGWDPTGKPEKERSEEEFLAHIARHFQNDEAVDPEQVARAVFTVLAKHVSEGEVEDVLQVLPKTLRRLWPPPAPPPA
ncbi:MAG: hypothetical protein JWN85_4307 [Gammaproteobacteria bacterium]|nr:hypothetical protein [Gammaproteobacteria bacterium]